MEIYTTPTPNPNALKFVISTKIKEESSSTYKNPSEADHNPLAFALLTTLGVDAVYFRENFITVTKFDYKKWDDLEPKVIEVIEILLEFHDPSYEDPDDERSRRELLSPELLKIEKIFDRTIRNYLQSDGGDIHTIQIEGDYLTVKFIGACGSCPASQTSTLQAVIGTLKQEYNPKISVIVT